jgi:hypothetical protein
MEVQTCYVEKGLPRIMPVGNGIMQMNLLFQAFYSFTSQVGLVGRKYVRYASNKKSI